LRRGSGGGERGIGRGKKELGKKKRPVGRKYPFRGLAWGPEDTPFLRWGKQKNFSRQDKHPVKKTGKIQLTGFPARGEVSQCEGTRTQEDEALR